MAHPSDELEARTRNPARKEAPADWAYQRILCAVDHHSGRTDAAK